MKNSAEERRGRDYGREEIIIIKKLLIKNNPD